MAKIKVLHGGMLTTVQDKGRKGYQQYGISTAGVMDEYSYALANALVANPKGEAVLEITYMGPRLLLEEDMVLAVTGADLTPMVDGVEIPMYQSIRVPSGSTLSFGTIKKGVRAYLAFGGSIDVPLVGGSKSTLVKSKMGGFHGRPLKAGDELEVMVNPDAPSGKVLQEQYKPNLLKEHKIGVVLGPQDDYFDEKALAQLFSEQGYRLSNQVDRMGLRLSGTPLQHKKGADILSDATVMGSIQVPQDGLPIILMADRQTTGGYTKIATVIREDLCKLAQLGPGDSISFYELSLQEAQRRYAEFDQRIRHAIESIK